MSLFGAPFGLWALLALPAIVALHWFRRRHRDRVVSGLFLWEDAGRAAQAGPRRRPLRRDASLWLELAAALLAALYLADFRPTGAGRAQRLVVVLDDSASMGARDPGAGGPDAQALARAAIEARLKAIGRRGRVTLVDSGPRPELLAGPDALPMEARAALAAWRPLAPDHDLAPALAFARELAGGGPVTLVTDRMPEPESFGAEVEVVAVGAPLPNVGFVAASRQRAEEGDELRLAVRNFAATEQQRLLRLRAGAVLLQERPLALESGATLRLTVPVPRDAPTLTLELDPDALAADDRATLPPPPPRPVRVWVDLEPSAAQALRVDRLLEALPEVLRAADGEAADLAIAHAPAAAPAWSLVLPRNAGEMEAFAGPFAAERRWPLLDGVVLEGVLWTRSIEFAMPGLPRVAAGGVPLLAEESGAAPVLRLNLVPARSTLQQTSDWPILWSNLIAAVRAGLPGPSASALACGETFRFRAAAPTDLRLTGGGLDRSWPAAEELELDDLPAADDYVLAGPAGALAAFAVNFHDPAESNLASRGGGVRLAPPLQAELARAESPLRALWLAGCAAVLAGHGWLLGRRREA